MNNRVIFYIGLLGVVLFAASAIVGGILIEDYSIVSQFISESYAVDTKYGMHLRIFGYIPSGIFITLFCFLAFSYVHKNALTRIGFYGLGIFYGLATIAVGIFPCDKGCNKEFIDPSLSQIIHNFIGLLTYAFVPICIILIGIGLRRSQHFNKLSIIAIALGILSMLFVALLFSDPNSNYIGLLQRIIEIFFMLWIITCAFTIRNNSTRPTS